MLRPLALALLLLVIAFPAIAAEPTPLAEAKLSLDDLPTDERTFYLRIYMTTTTGSGDDERVSVNPKDAGTFTLSATKTDEAITFKTNLQFTVMGNMTIDQTMTCQPTLLMPPTAIDLKMQRGKRTQEAKLTIADGVATATTPDGQTREMPGYPPENSVTFQGLISLLELLPRDAEKDWTISALGEMVEMDYMQPAGDDMEHILIDCVGDDAIQVGDAELKCTRYDIKTGYARRDIAAWVNDDGLQQLRLGTDMRMTRQPMKPIDKDTQDPFTDLILKALEAAEAEEAEGEKE